MNELEYSHLKYWDWQIGWKIHAKKDKTTGGTHFFWLDNLETKKKLWFQDFFKKHFECCIYENEYPVGGKTK